MTTSVGDVTSLVALLSSPTAAATAAVRAVMVTMDANDGLPLYGS